jgi:hypothetical protein
VNYFNAKLYFYRTYGDGQQRAIRHESSKGKIMERGRLRLVWGVALTSLMAKAIAFTP